MSEASDLIGATGHPAVPVTPDVSDPSSIEAAHDADSGLGGFHADVASAKSFYSDVLGWETDDQPMGEFTYTVIRPAGGGENSGQGGIMPLSPEMAATGATTRWQPYFEVADCDAAAAAVTANGGTVVVPASDVPGVGRFAVALDPDGAQFAVIASVPA